MEEMYKVHDIQLVDRPIFSPGGRVEPQRTVTYYIGVHGPFYIQDKPEALTPAAIKKGIEDHIEQLRILETIGQDSSAL